MSDYQVRVVGRGATSIGIIVIGRSVVMRHHAAWKKLKHKYVGWGRRGFLISLVRIEMPNNSGILSEVEVLSKEDKYYYVSKVIGRYRFHGVGAWCVAEGGGDEEGEGGLRQ